MHDNYCHYSSICAWSLCARVHYYVLILLCLLLISNAHERYKANAYEYQANQLVNSFLHVFI